MLLLPLLFPPACADAETHRFSSALLALSAPLARSLWERNKRTQLCFGQPTTAKVTFQLPHHVPFGQEVLITGDSDALGSWSPVKARKLAWQEGDVWRVTVDLPAETAVQYKYVGSLPTLPHTHWYSLCPALLPLLFFDERRYSNRNQQKDGSND